MIVKVIRTILYYNIISLLLGCINIDTGIDVAVSPSGIDTNRVVNSSEFYTYAMQAYTEKMYFCGFTDADIEADSAFVFTLALLSDDPSGLSGFSWASTGLLYTDYYLKRSKQDCGKAIAATPCQSSGQLQAEAIHISFLTSCFPEKVVFTKKGDGSWK
ncbi:hypothetical protein [Leptospira interrogans]|uniref:Lipoprotein n=2 Tax=Leptospira interrogans TaxID=173 RepID=M6GMS9_LEPIR|nr:hypothetical protein [Leptospira interrogans]EMM83864.1 hypothetical protein LEP1GSC037_0373 [Leptospira interrogans str. 2006001854]